METEKSAVAHEVSNCRRLCIDQSKISLGYLTDNPKKYAMRSKVEEDK